MFYLPPTGADKILAMLQAYFDESGIHGDAPACVVAGFVGPAESWAELLESWSSTLAAYGLRDFKATEFFGRDSKRRRVGRFWNWTDEKAEEFMDRLLAPVMQADIAFVGTSVHVSAFASLTENQRRFLTGALWMAGQRATEGAPATPFFHAFQDTVAQILEIVRVGHVVQFFFDSQKQFADLVLQQFQELRGFHAGDARLGGGLIFNDRLSMPMLQLADLVAHLWYCGHRDAIHKDDLAAERRRTLAILSQRWPGIKTWDANLYRLWLEHCERWLEGAPEDLGRDLRKDLL